MSLPLLTTKLHPPANPSHLIRRNRLIDQLDTHLVTKDKFQRKLTLISAPAGYGKTTLILEWLDTHDILYSWLSLERGDNDPIRFLTYLAAVLQQIDPTIGVMIGMTGLLPVRAMKRTTPITVMVSASNRK